MLVQCSVAQADIACVSLVAGEPATRRIRQLLLRAEHYEVRAYPTCAAILADNHALGSCCLIADLDMDGLSGLQLAREMRRAGWTGWAILLTDAVPPELSTLADAERIIAILPTSPADRPLLEAVRSAVRASGT